MEPVEGGRYVADHIPASRFVELAGICDPMLGHRGIAVHIGARIASLAGPSEVLTSQTVNDLTAGSGLIFEDAGEHGLKGVPDRWHLSRVVK